MFRRPPARACIRSNPARPFPDKKWGLFVWTSMNVLRAHMTLTADPDLVSRAKNGDRSAFDQLVGPLVEPAFRLAYGMLHDRNAAEDAVQEAAIRSWRKLNNLRPGTEMRPWFLAIVANQCRTIARGRWWPVLRLDDPVGSASTEFEDEFVRSADLRAALRKLSP